MIGKKLSPVLEEIELTLLEYEANIGIQPEFTDEGFRAGIKIFSSVVLDRIWNLQESEELSMDDRIKMAESFGNKIREIVKTYTNIDTRQLYNK
jgi:hypothetical protein